MNNPRRNPDAALDAILADPEVATLRRVRDDSLAVLLTGARGRRRRHRVRRIAGLAVLPVLALGSLWLSSHRPGAGAGDEDAPVVPSVERAERVAVIHTGSTSGPDFVVTPTPPAVIVSSERGLETVPTRRDAEELDQVSGDPALLAAVPGSVGFIGAGSERLLVWDTRRSGEGAAGP